MYVNAVRFRQPATADHEFQQLEIAWPRRPRYESHKQIWNEIEGFMNFFDYPGQFDITIGSNHLNISPGIFFPLYTRNFDFMLGFDKEAVYVYLGRFIPILNSMGGRGFLGSEMQTIGDRNDIIWWERP